MPTLAAWLHTIDPYAIMLWEGGPIRWYGLSYLLGFLIGYLVIRRVAAVGVSTLKPAQVGDLIVCLALSVVIGGRLGYCLFYKISLFTSFDGVFPFWGLLKLNEGGMASHGGMIGGIVGCFYFAWRHKEQPVTFLLDLFAFGAPLGLFFGRIANFINGELYGRPCSPTLPWAVKFPQEMYEWTDAQRQTLAPVFDHVTHRTWFGGPVSNYDISEIIRQLQSGNHALARAIQPLLTPRHPSQLYEALLEGLVVFLVLAFLWRKPRKPLVIGGAFAIAYAIVRIFGEQFRTPDAQIIGQEFAHWGVTRGQLLSVLLLIAGIVLVWVFGRRDAERMGGWRRKG
jgi:phosphatidylglycerol:prolipoprotein diacylglycerol transferase